MKKLNIVTKRTYQGNDGTMKNVWFTVGTLTVFEATNDRPEGYSIELGMFPETKFHVFEQKEKNAQAPAQKPKVAGTEIDYPQDVNPEDIPF